MSDKNQEFQKNVNEQSGVEGQRKEVNVGDYPKFFIAIASDTAI
jgi:hypothetical protein